MCAYRPFAALLLALSTVSFLPESSAAENPGSQSIPQGISKDRRSDGKSHNRVIIRGGNECRSEKNQCNEDVRAQYSCRVDQARRQSCVDSCPPKPKQQSGKGADKHRKCVESCNRTESDTVSECRKQRDAAKTLCSEIFQQCDKAYKARQRGR